MADPTLTGTDLAATQTETAGNPSPDPAPALPANGFTAFDADGDALTGARVRISTGFLSDAGHQDLLTINGAQSGSAGAISWAYDPGTGEMILTGAGTFADYEALLDGVGFLATGDNPTDYDADLSRTIAYSVRDDTNYSNEFLATVAVNGANDAPVSGGASAASGSEDDFAIAGTVPTASDVDSNVLTYSLVAGSVLVDGVSAPDATVAFDSFGNYSYTPTAADQALGDGQSHIITFDYVANDGSEDSAPATVTVTVNGANDAPFIDLDFSDSPATGTSLVYGEGQAPVTIAPYALVDDVDQPPNYDGYIVTVAFTANGTADDQLGIVNTGFGPTDVHVIGSDIYYGTTLVAAFTGGENGAPLVISFNSDACGCSLEAVTASIAFSNVSDDPSTLQREVTFTVDDGAAADSSGSAIALIDVVANDPPVLTDLATSVTFAENLVNAAPQLLDASVTLTDPDGNFDGATLTVTGLLPEDQAGIRDVGTGPGEISVSGFDILYAGTLIGTVCGCSDSLTLLFNADATAEAVEAVIENLTYANISDSPTLSRTLIINVTDSFGADLGVSPATGGTPHFEPLAGPANPFDATFVYGLAAPAFVDLDGDGDLDLVVGDATGTLSVFENDHGLFAPVAPAGNPFAGLVLDYAAKPAFVDIDGDSDLDLVVGGYDGALQLFRNDAGAFTEVTGAANPFDGMQVAYAAAAPAFVDLDGDGDLDLVVGDDVGTVHAFGNDAGVFTELTGVDNPFDAILVDYAASPTFVDLDGDGDLDLVVGDADGVLHAYGNDGGAFTALTGADDPFAGLYGGYYASPAFVDLDGDGDMDLVVGSVFGTLQAFEQTPAHGQLLVVNVTPENDAPLIDLDLRDSPEIDTSASFTEGDPPLTIAPFAVFADFDQPADYGGYVITVEITANGEAADTLTIADIGPGASEIEISGSDVLYQGVVVGSFTGGSAGDPLVVTFNSDACACSVELTLANILFSNGSQDPSELARTITFTLDDGQGGAATAEATIEMTALDDASVAIDDANGTPENAILNASVFGNDSDPDDPLTVEEVNGQAVNVGSEIILTSGAKLKLNADGTYSYDPNGKFNTLTNTSSGEIGAVNVSATDSFTYKLVGGNTATVTITVGGVVSPQDRLEGDGTDNVITGTPNGDFFDLSQGGNDTASGLGSNDGFFFGAAFTGADQVDGGGGTNDQIGLQGDYTGPNALVLGPSTISNIEAIVVLPGYSYEITTDDGNVPLGGVLKVQATPLGAGESLTFDGSAETDGSFLVYGGRGDDTMIGGAGNDGFYFGPGGFNSSDTVDGGAGNNDQLALDGDYGGFGPAFVLGGNVTSVEVVVLLPGPSGSPNTFNLTTNESFVPAGQTMTIFGLQVATNIVFDGSNEHDGAFRIYGGGGNDIFTGSTGNDWIFGGGGGDLLTGGAGADTYYFDDASQSTSLGFDTIFGFDDSVDTIDVPFAVTGLATPASGNLSNASFDADLSTAFAGLTSHEAGMFTATGGDMAGRTFLVIDADGNAGYQAGSDYVIEIVAPVTPIDNPAIFV